jgi:ElaB/YqjD/DUF883 family membrane-anchored ribosome-binding protein
MNPIPAETTKEKLFQEFNTVVAETEQLIKTAAGAGSDKAGALKASLDQEFSAASERLARIRDDAVAQCTAVAKTTDAYVQGNPWRSVGIVATFAVATGLIAGLLISRR